MFILMLAFSLLSNANNIGFAHGDTFSAVPLSGQLRVFCPSGSPQLPGPVIANYNCRDVVLDPVAYDHFLGPAGLKADEVQITSLREDGTTRSKSVKYDSGLARTKSKINLWISTLFQRPLFKEGRNKISYTMVLGGAAVGQGNYEILVQRGAARSCPASSYSSADAEDCRSPYSVCERYFSRYNNCTLK